MKMNDGRIVVTAMGAITPIGLNVDDYWNNLVAGECGVDAITRFDTTDLPVKFAAEIKDFDPLNWMTKKQTREMDLFMQYGYAAACQALDEYGEIDNPERFGIVIGTALSGVVETGLTQEGLTSGAHAKVSPRFIPKIIGNVTAAQIAIAKGIKGPSLTVSTACSSGGDAISTGAMLLMTGQADAVLVVGAEAAISPLTIRGLSAAHALSTNNENAKVASRPFDKDRDGFVMGEGGGAILLETEEHALSRKADIKAELAGFANCTDGYHVTSPHPEGIGAIFCMEGAMNCAGVSKEEVGYINTHGTSTPMGDPIETNAIKKLFGEYAPEIAVNSTKGSTGHMMGAGGITEAITCIQTIRTGVVPPTLHLDNVDPACEGLNFVPNEAQKKEVNVAMSNSFGFGGQNSSVLFKKYC